MRVRIGSKAAATAVAALAVAGLIGAPPPLARAATAPARGSFYTYTGSTPLAQVAPGTVLKTRILSYHIAGIALPVQVVQLLYRSAGALGQPTANVTSVLEPLVRPGSPRAVSYQSFYDSLNPADEPSVQIAGGVTLGGLAVDAESVVIAPLLLQGYTVIVPDTEGQTADFASGPEYGKSTLNSVRAATNSPLTGLGRPPRSACSATQEVPSRPTGPPSWHRPTPPTSTASWSARPKVACSSTRPTISGT